MLDRGGAHIAPVLSGVAPYRPDTIVDGGSYRDLVVRAVSLRGRAKRYAGGPRQDDMCVLGVRAGLVVAVADGLSSGQRSHVGASLAVRHVTAALTEQLETVSVDELDWHAAFQRAAWSLVDEQRRHTGDPKATSADAVATLGSTLAVAVISPEGERWILRTACVGDSPVLHARMQAVYTLAGHETSDGMFVSHRTEALPFLPSVIEPVAMPLEVDDLVIVATDGFSKPFAEGRSPAGSRLLHGLEQPPDLVQFAYAVDFNQESFDDDRTAVCVWLRPQVLPR